MCTQAPAPAYTMCTQAPAPDWLGPVLNQSGVLKFAAGACIHNVYPGAGAWVHILAPFAPSVTRYNLQHYKTFSSPGLIVHCTVQLSFTWPA